MRHLHYHIPPVISCFRRGVFLMTSAEDVFGQAIPFQFFSFYPGVLDLGPFVVGQFTFSFLLVMMRWAVAYIIYFELRMLFYF